jgi:hypothetical protein
MLEFGRRESVRSGFFVCRGPTVARVTLSRSHSRATTLGGVRRTLHPSHRKTHEQKSPAGARFLVGTVSLEQALCNYAPRSNPAETVAKGSKVFTVPYKSRSPHDAIPVRLSGGQRVPSLDWIILWRLKYGRRIMNAKGRDGNLIPECEESATPFSGVCRVSHI